MQKQQPSTTPLLIILLVLFFTTTRIANAQRGRKVGTRTQVPDVKTNKEIQDLGKFSVEEYNRNILTDDVAPTPLRGVGGFGHGGGGGGGDGRLVFLEVVEAERQVVAGLKYYLKVEAMQDGLSMTFDAVVVVKPWIKSKKLVNFGPSRHPN